MHLKAKSLGHIIIGSYVLLKQLSYIVSTYENMIYTRESILKITMPTLNTAISFAKHIHFKFAVIFHDLQTLFMLLTRDAFFQVYSYILNLLKILVQVSL